MFLFLPFIINVKMLSIYILIKSWAPWSNIHISDCKGPKIKPDSWLLFSYSGILIQARAIKTLGRGRRETTPVGLGQAGSCQLTLKLDQIWAETMDNAGNDKFWSASVKTDTSVIVSVSCDDSDNTRLSRVPCYSGNTQHTVECKIKICHEEFIIWDG